MKAGLRDLGAAWRLPGRALLFGLPLTCLGTALLAFYICDLTWPEALLVGAALSPTDPLFAAAIVGNKDIPGRLRHLLNVESGLNDGLAFPLVVILLSWLRASEPRLAQQAGELALGAGLGIAVPWLATRVERSRFFAVAESYGALFALSIGLLIFSLASLTHANEYLAAFAAGATIASVCSNLRHEFEKLGEMLVEIFKLAALLVFGAMISPPFFSGTSAQAFLFALLALVAVRPVALWLALLGARLSAREKIAAYWFGPKGFASVVYGLLILNSGAPRAGHIFHLIALVVIASILAHSSTDVVVARWFRSAK